MFRNLEDALVTSVIEDVSFKDAVEQVVNDMDLELEEKIESALQAFDFSDAIGEYDFSSHLEEVKAQEIVDSEVFKNAVLMAQIKFLRSDLFEKQEQETRDKIYRNVIEQFQGNVKATNERIEKLSQQLQECTAKVQQANLTIEILEDRVEDAEDNQFSLRETLRKVWFIGSWF